MAAAAAEASTTTALAFFRLVTFRTGIIYFSYRVTVFRVYVRRTWVLPLPCVVFIVVPFIGFQAVTYPQTGPVLPQSARQRLQLLFV